MIFLVIALSLVGVGLLEAMQYDIGRLFMPCGFKVSRNLPCPTCGYTTSLRAFVQGHLMTAFKIQPAAWMLCVALSASAMIGLYVGASGHYPHWLRKGLAECTLKHLLFAFLLVVLLGWAVVLAQTVSQKT
ncbi:MAG: DUF2752 domain-containing protein [Phycisphaeraceae bacterium]|nr:DUF2752 domain-containing protein [Phycisphaeraceae bacterium]